VGGYPKSVKQGLVVRGRVGGRAAARARGNEINTDRRSNELLTCQFAVFSIVNQTYQEGITPKPSYIRSF
jgi:hypothetical protein